MRTLFALSPTSNCLPDSFDANFVRSISNLQRFLKPFDANKFALFPTSNCLPDSLSYAGVGVQKVWETFWSGRY